MITFIQHLVTAIGGGIVTLGMGWAINRVFFLQKTDCS